MNRRNFIRTSGLSLAYLLTSDSIFAERGSPYKQLINYPDSIVAMLSTGNQELIKNGNDKWSYKDIIISFKQNENNLGVFIEAPESKLFGIQLQWDIAEKKDMLILNDHWERTYGDVSWHRSTESEILPWYFLEWNGKSTNGFGIKTGAPTFCYWQINGTKLNLNIDTRSGGNGVLLGHRKLAAAEIVTMKGLSDDSAFLSARKFMQLLCDKVRWPLQPVYGINDWYFTYGNNSDELIIEHTELMMPMAVDLSNKPFSVIDAGWFQTSPLFPNDSSWGENLVQPNSKFKDMQKLSEKIKQIGMRPGLWTRPLCASSTDDKSLTLSVNRTKADSGQPVLDPSIPENLERIKNYIRKYNEWGYELVKFDYTTFDIFGKWGIEMIKDRTITEKNWSMYDRSKTNAEIILNLYKSIREAAGNTYIIGCNTFSHLSAGLFELNRIGDDTSGNEWSRTRKMGVNTLAFRGIQHGTFYAADADCVGLTTKIPWDKNKQWMELVSKCGTPLFISAQPEAIGAEQKKSIKAAFEIASQNTPLGEPLDWMQHAFPVKWKLNGKTETFNWD